MIVAEFITSIQRLESAESSGRLSAPIVKQAASLWQNEMKGFKHWYGANDDETIGTLMQGHSEKGIQQFVYDLATEMIILAGFLP